MNFPMLRTFIVTALTPIFFGIPVTVIAQGDEDVSDVQCQKYVNSCSKEIANVRINNPACKPLRRCKKVCSGEKQVCKTSCRNLKQECKNTCKKKYRSGKEYRQCKKQCRNLKKECKKDCRTVRTNCKQVCRTTYKTPACRAERAKNATAIFKSIGACTAAALCLDQRDEESPDDFPDK